MYSRFVLRDVLLLTAFYVVLGVAGLAVTAALVASGYRNPPHVIE